MMWAVPCADCGKPNPECVCEECHCEECWCDAYAPPPSFVCIDCEAGDHADGYDGDE